MGGARSPLDRLTSSRVSIAFNAAQGSSSNPFWSPAQPSQSGQRTPFRIHSAFIPNRSIDSPEQSCGSPTPFKLSTARALSSPARNVVSPTQPDSSSDDSDFSPKKSVATSTHSVATPSHPILSPMQFLSSPSQAVLERLIPFPDKENEDSDDVASIFED